MAEIALSAKGVAQKRVDRHETFGLPAVFRTHDAPQVRSNRSRTKNRLASAQVTNSWCAFLSSPR